ncbi:MAG: YraN family protein, partial [Chitinophagales bacterium]
MSKHKQQLGKKGESIACAYLLKNNYQILEQNWRSSNQEIDIIAQKENTLVFVEVKTRSDTQFGNPELAVNTTKQAQIYKAAEAYIHKSETEYNDLRFDV